MLCWKCSAGQGWRLEEIVSAVHGSAPRATRSAPRATERRAREGPVGRSCEGFIQALVGGVKPFKSPERRKLLAGVEGWLRERFIRHRGNADVVRQDLLAEKGVTVSRRTLQPAVRCYRQGLKG